MAKTKKPLTPEQAEIKAIKKAKRGEAWTKFFAVVLALALTLATVALGKSAGTPDEAEASADQGGAGMLDSVGTDDDMSDLFGDSNDGSADNSGSTYNGGSTDNSGSADNGGSTSNGGTTAATGKAAAIKTLNEETAKAAKGNYKWSRVCNYTDDGAINLGSDTAKNIIDGIIKAIDENSSVDSVVGGFLGVGTKEGEVKGGKAPDGMSENYLLKGMSLTEADVTNYKQDGNKYLFQIANCTNPQKDGSNALHHATNDFITESEVKSSIAEFTTAITVEKTQVAYGSILLTAYIEGGKLTSLEMSYIFAAQLNLKAGLTISGSGKAKTVEKYTAISY